jgi:hypothetical protein
MSTTNYLDTTANYLESKKCYQEGKENYLKATKLSKRHSDLVPVFDEPCFFHVFFKKGKLEPAERIS